MIGHLIDFSLAVRGPGESEFSTEDALISQMMEAAAAESVRQEGRHIQLPLPDDIENDATARKQPHQQFGCDPMDVEAMLAISYPKP